MFGLTYLNSKMSGNVDIVFDLADMSGIVVFKDIESDDRTWFNDSLTYAIQATGNTFVQTGGDMGRLTGAFFGGDHQFAGGVLKRGDLSAAFGAERGS